MSELVAALTGIGVVSPIGIGYDDFADSVAQGVAGLAPCSANPSVLAGEVLGFDVNRYLVAEKTYLDRCSEFALAATKLCLDHAGLERPPADEERAGIVLGTMFGCHVTMLAYTDRVRKRGVRFATPLLFSHAFANTPASLVSIDFRLRGYHATVTSGRSSGTLALQTALVALAAGHADCVLAGGVEALSRELVEAYCEELFAGDDPDEYDPFAEHGLVLGEGAAILLLESIEHAQARGAEVLAVLRCGGDEPTDARLVSTELAPHHAADEHCAAPSGLYGDSLGAAGALAAAAAVAALRAGVIPPVRGGEGDVYDRREPQGPAPSAVEVADPRARLRVSRP
ncbi:MAG: hypothetical protein HYU66_08120 [Armatimonadetes bacterium]|nr:hypothetical protein [Armatimonadota bacterium]